MLSEPETSICTVVEIFCEFLEVVFHNILYARKLYPETIFERKRKYGVPVFQSIHPGVNEYISKCIRAVSFHLKRNQLKSVLLCFNLSENVVERYVFQVHEFDSALESDPFLVKLEKYLSEFCLNLQSCISHLCNLPKECAFNIQLQVSEYAELELRQDTSLEEFLWIASSVNETSESSAIIPLLSIKTTFLNLLMHIEKFC